MTSTDNSARHQRRPIRTEAALRIDLVSSSLRSARGRLSGRSWASGALGSAVIIATFGDRMPRGLCMLGGVALYGVSVVAFAASPWFQISTMLMVIVGFANVCSHALVQTVIQTYSPPEFRGRAIALFHMGQVVMTVGSMLIGSLAAMFGTAWSVGVMGSAGALAMLAVHIIVPRAWRIR